MDLDFDYLQIESPLIERIWHTHSEKADTFTSTAGTNWEMVITHFQGETTFTVRGPETQASMAEIPLDAEFFGITFTLGTYMPHLPIGNLVNRQDVYLPQASSQSFWFNGSVWEYPRFDNVDVFIKRMVQGGLLERDPIVESVLQGQSPNMSLRSIQRRFVNATGISYKTIQQIERANQAVTLLAQGQSILDTVAELEYYDQAHLTNALTRFMGQTPAQAIQQKPNW